MMTKICKTCNYCKKFYRLTWYRYFCNGREHVFYCTAFEKQTEKESTCENWSKIQVEYDVSLQRLIDAENDIRFLLEHLEDIKKQFTDW